MDEQKSIAGYDPEYEVIETLRDASMEIKQLRDRNGFLQARMSGFDDALLLVRAETERGNGLTQGRGDTVYRIDSLVERRMRQKEKQVAEVLSRPVGYGVSVNGGEVKTKESSVVKAKTRKFGKRGPMSAEQKAAISATMKKKARAKAKGSKKKN